MFDDKESSMARRMYWIARRTVALFGAGILLQTGGCALDTNTLAAGLASTIANNLISSLVFGSFNLAGP